MLLDGLNNRKAMTLIEVVLSILIFTVAFSGVLSIMAQRQQSVYVARHHESAMTLCQQRVEGLRNMGYTSVSALGTLTTETVTVDSAGSGLSGVLSTEIWDEGTHLEVLVSVSWLENTYSSSPQTHVESLATIINN